MDLCGKVISAVSDCDQVYFMKLEVYWILTNLSVGDEDEVNLILGRESSLKPKHVYGLPQSILSLLDRHLRTLVQDTQM